MKTKQLLFFMALLLVFTANAQTIITVDNTPDSGAQYDNVQAAIAAASPGDYIYIQPSETTYGAITIDKELHLRGFSHSDANKVTYIDYIDFDENASDSSFSGLHITGNILVQNLNTVLTGLKFENNIVEGSMGFRGSGVTGMTIRGNIIYRIGFSNSSSNEYSNSLILNNIIEVNIGVKYYQTVIIKNNLFFTSNPVYNYNYANGTISVQNNIIYYSSSSNIDVNNNGVEFDHCLAYNLGSGNMSELDGTDNIINMDPLFVSAEDDNFDAYLDDYHLQAGSPAAGNGAGGLDMGLYDGLFEFNNFGFTNNLPTVSITYISSSVPQNGEIEVTIETKAN